MPVSRSVRRRLQVQKKTLKAATQALKTTQKHWVSLIGVDDVKNGYIIVNSVSYWVDIDTQEVWRLKDKRRRPKDWRMLRDGREAYRVLGEFSLRALINSNEDKPILFMQR